MSAMSDIAVGWLLSHMSFCLIFSSEETDGENGVKSLLKLIKQFYFQGQGKSLVLCLCSFTELYTSALSQTQCCWDWYLVGRESATRWIFIWRCTKKGTFWIWNDDILNFFEWLVVVIFVVYIFCCFDIIFKTFYRKKLRIIPCCTTGKFSKVFICSLFLCRQK